MWFPRQAKLTGRAVGLCNRIFCFRELISLLPFATAKVKNYVVRLFRRTRARVWTSDCEMHRSLDSNSVWKPLQWSGTELQLTWSSWKLQSPLGSLLSMMTVCLCFRPVKVKLHVLTCVDWTDLSQWFLNCGADPAVNPLWSKQRLIL